MAIHAGEPGTIERLPAVSGCLPCDPFPRGTMLTFVHLSLTQATDTSNIRLVFAAVKETILQNALKDSGIL